MEEESTVVDIFLRKEKKCTVLLHPSQCTICKATFYRALTQRWAQRREQIGGKPSQGPTCGRCGARALHTGSSNCFGGRPRDVTE